MKRSLIILFWLLCFKSYSQSKVVYIIPESVEGAIKARLIMSKYNEKTSSGYFLLEKDTAGTYSLSLFNSIPNPDTFIGKILANTNRFVLVDKNKFPLIFDYDFTFGTPRDDQVGTFGHRDGEVVRSVVLFHGYTIVFDRRGKIIDISEY